MVPNERKAGDFTGLAEDYSNNRPDYSPSVLNALLGMLDKPTSNTDFADIGAGTGIWTRMVASAGVKSIVAVEPNDDMRSIGQGASQNFPIVWKSGSAEKTGLPTERFDLVSMASSFHWADFDTATREFSRILRVGGRFTALWNPRLIEVNPMLVEIEAYLNTLRPDIKRVSSGRSGVTYSLTEKLSGCRWFEDIVYLEGRHTINMSKERYMGAWRSVNDLRVQLGRLMFDRFLDYVEKRIEEVDSIEATYLTRAWSAKKRE
jgi:ubiquinone/menaquinone biosynthesis C-methylase UbiE